MKKSHIATLLVFFLLIPATLFLGTRLPGRSYYITGTAIIIELLIPFFMAFEGRKPQARELVLLAVMCAMAIVGRVAIPIPNFKAIFGIIMLTGIAFGPEAGFMVGAIAAFGSNFFAGHGIFTPWQMFSYGLGGMLAGFCFGSRGLPQKPWVMAAFGFLTVVVLIGPILDSMAVFLGYVPLKESFWVVFVPGFAANCLQGLCTVAVMFLFGKPLLNMLNRIKCKYGLAGERECENR